MFLQPVINTANKYIFLLDKFLLIQEKPAFVLNFAFDKSSKLVN
jgi:hypothetical protein